MTPSCLIIAFAKVWYSTGARQTYTNIQKISEKVNGIADGGILSAPPNFDNPAIVP